MRTTRIALAAIAGLAASAVALSGCGVGSSPSKADDVASKAATGEVKGEISFQTWNLKASFQDYFEGVIKDFETQHPGTKVTWIDQPADGYADKLSADAAAGTLPDVINLDGGTGYPLAKAGMLMDLGKADPEAKNDYLPEAWAAADWKALGGQFGYPWYLSTGPSLFNTAMFDKAGLDGSKLPTTYDDLFTQATAMAQKADGNYSMIGSSPTIEVMGMYGSQIMSEDGSKFTFNDAKGVELVTRYKELYDNGGMLKESLSQTYTGQDAQFQSGKIAYMPGSAYNIDQIKQNAPTIYKTLKVGDIITNTEPNMYFQMVAVNAKTKNAATAKAFAKFVTNAKNQLDFAKTVAVFPSTAGTLDDPYFTKTDGSLEDEVRVASADQIKKAKMYSPAAFTEAMKTELRNQIALAIEGKKPVQQALDETVEFCNKRLAS